MNVKSETMKSFFDKYRDRYGENRMNPKTMDMWWNSLGTFENDVFIKASEALLGSKPHAFGWKELQAAILALNQGPDDQHLKNEKKWKEHPDYQTNDGKRKRITEFMNEAIDKIHKGEGLLTWRQEYVAHFVEVWGVKEARRQIRLINDSDTFPGFSRSIADEIWKVEQNGKS